MNNVFKRIWLYFQVSTTFFESFWQGEKWMDIKSACLTEVAYHYNVKEKKYDKAINYYRKALQIKHANYYAHGGIATALCACKKYHDALDHINTAIELRPKEIQTKLWQVLIYECLGDNELYQNTLDDVVSSLDDQLMAYDWLAEKYYDLGMFKRAEGYCNKALKGQPTTYSFYYNLSLVHAAQKNYSGALEASYKALQLSKEKKWKKKILRNIKYFKEATITNH